MSSARCVTVWEYCHLGPANSFQAMVPTLKHRFDQGWELAGVTSHDGRVSANLRRRVHVRLGSLEDGPDRRAA